jgi:hypothetical protein
MENMDRRQFLRASAFFGISGVLAGFSLWKTVSSRKTLVLITADPRKDLVKLKRVAKHYDLFNLTVTTSPVQPTPQDITLLIDGRLQDPAESKIGSPLYEFALDLRSRTQPAAALITLEEAALPGKEVTFEYNGKIVESIPLNKKYDCIDIPGDLGNTCFRIKNGGMSVVHSSCAHRLCEKMGEIHRGKIVCAPNRIIASMPERISKYDAVTG